MGKVRVRFTPPNEFGVIDHDVTLPSGEVNHNPLRIVNNGSGSEVIFTLYWLPGMSDEDFARDGKMIEEDLARLRSLFES